MIKKVIFLDRDGVINQERGEYTYRLSDFTILEDVKFVLKEWFVKGFQFIIISNQGGVGKGIYSCNEVMRLNDFLVQELQKESIELLDFYFCPHHPEHSGKCLCRKPDSLLFEKSLAKHQILPQNAFMIGDKERDIYAAEKAGIRSFLMESNSSLKKFISLIP